MQVSKLTIPDGIERPSNKALAVYTKQILHNREICDHCFQQIKVIGEEKTKQLETSGRRRLSHGQPIEITINGVYERTDDAEQDHTPWDEHEGNRRFGACFCLNCGAEGGTSADSASLETLTERAKRIIRYLNTKTQYHCVGSDFGEALRKLKRIPDNTGLDAEILAVATTHSLESISPNVTAKATAD